MGTEIEMKIDYKKENQSYWEKRAEGYSKVNQEELSTAQHVRWQQFLDRQIRAQFGEKKRSEIRILEVGTGPGFFAIILSELGYQVTAVDYTREMLHQARQNAKAYGQSPCFLEMDAQNLTFPSETFDVVLSRNLTWDLPDPEMAYREWVRVLAEDGLLLVFDANWYGYLFDDAKRALYNKDREQTKERGIRDEYTGTDIDSMEKIAREAPLSKIVRPAWDRLILSQIGVREVETVEEVWQEVWSEEEKVNFSATPMFMVKGRK